MSTARRTISAELRERTFADAVADVARMYGWKIFHVGAARTSKGWRTPVRYDGRGFVDWTMVHPERRLIWHRELKAGRNQLDEHQQLWRNWLVSAGADWALWYERDFDAIVAAVSFGKAVPQ